MHFDPAIFEADVALNLIPSEQLPATAQDALEAGFDGPHVLRMAIIDPRYGWEIDQALPPMLSELGCSFIPKKDAALRLAKQRAQSILATNADPLPSVPYFYRLMISSDYPGELTQLGYLADEFESLPDDLNGQRELAVRALEDFLSPEPYEKRVAERQAAWTRQREEAKKEWPYVLASPTGRALLKERYKERLEYIRPLFGIEVIAWLMLGWASSSWRLALVGFAVTLPLLLALALWGEYRRLKCERRDLLFRMRVPEDQI